MDELGRKAVTVEWLVSWAFAREKVHLARMPGMGEAAMFAARAFPKASSSERIGAAVGSSMNLGFEAPADAYAVHYAVLALGAVGKMVRTFGLMGSCARPDWTPHPVIRTEPGAAGLAMHEDKRGKRTLCQFRSFIYRGDLPAIVEERRRAYSEWARAIARLHGALSEPGKLVAHRLLPDVPLERPWTRAGGR